MVSSKELNERIIEKIHSKKSVIEIVRFIERQYCLSKDSLTPTDKVVFVYLNGEVHKIAINEKGLDEIRQNQLGARNGETLGHKDVLPFRGLTVPKASPAVLRMSNENNNIEFTLADQELDGEVCYAAMQALLNNLEPWEELQSKHDIEFKRVPEYGFLDMHRPTTVGANFTNTAVKYLLTYIKQNLSEASKLLGETTKAIVELDEQVNNFLTKIYENKFLNPSAQKGFGNPDSNPKNFLQKIVKEKEDTLWTVYTSVTDFRIPWLKIGHEYRHATEITEILSPCYIGTFKQALEELCISKPESDPILKRRFNGLMETANKNFINNSEIPKSKDLGTIGKVYRLSTNQKYAALKVNKVA